MASPAHRRGARPHPSRPPCCDAPRIRRPTRSGSGRRAALRPRSGPQGSAGCAPQPFFRKKPACVDIRLVILSLVMNDRFQKLGPRAVAGTGACAPLTAPGAAFETADTLVRGVTMRVWKTCPRHGGRGFRPGAQPWVSRIPGLSGRAGSVMRALPARRCGSRPCLPSTACRKATGWRW